MLQCIRNVLLRTQTKERYYPPEPPLSSRSLGTLHEEDVTTNQERHGSDLKNMFQRIRNVLARRRCYNVSGTCCWERRPKNAITPRNPLRSRSLGTLHEEDVTTNQERHGSDLKNMFQSIRNVLAITWRRCYSVSGTCCWERRKKNAITPPDLPQKRYAMCKSDNCPAPPWAPPPKTCTKNRLVPCLYTQLIGWIWWCHKFRGPLQWVARVCRLTRFWIWLRCRLLGQMRDLIPKTCKG